MHTQSQNSGTVPAKKAEIVLITPSGTSSQILTIFLRAKYGNDAVEQINFETVNEQRSLILSAKLIIFAPGDPESDGCGAELIVFESFREDFPQVPVIWLSPNDEEAERDRVDGPATTFISTTVASGAIWDSFIDELDSWMDCIENLEVDELAA